MIDCLTDLVGLDGCESSNAPYTLNQIGYSKIQLEDMMDDSYSTVDEFLEANKKTAAQMVISDFFGMITGGGNSKQVIESSIAGVYLNETAADSVTGIRGIYLKVYGGLEYWKINLGAITLFADYTGTVPISIYNLTTGEILKTVELTAEAGKISNVDLAFSFESNLAQTNLFVGYNTSGITPYKSQIASDACCGRKPTCTTSISSLYGGEIVSPFYYNSVTQKQTTSGLTLQYSIECNNEQFICSIKSMFGLAMLYRTAMSVLDYSKDAAGQFSNQKTINAEGNENRWTRAEYLYNNEKAKIKNQVVLPQNRCFSCRPRITVKTILPA